MKQYKINITRGSEGEEYRMRQKNQLKRNSLKAPQIDEMHQAIKEAQKMSNSLKTKKIISITS